MASATGGRQTAIVTGGASGMGAEFARQLAADGYDLVLIDKSAERVAAVAAEIRDKFQSQVETIEANLADREQLARVGQQLAQIPRPGMLVNAAGFGTMGLFADVDLDSQIDMIMVHVVASVYFVRAILPTMIAQKSGGIINICSINALMRFPQTVTYSSTKAYMLVFTETLHAELAGTGVRVQALCPGLTRTGFIDTPTMRGYDRTRDPVWLWMDARDVVATSLRALRRGKVTVIPGVKNRLFVLAFGSKTGIFLLRGYRRVRAFLKAHVPGFSRLP